MSLGAGKAMYTLDVRESKSSLAGVMMAAAMEGIGIYQFGEHVLPHIADVPGAVSDVLSRVNLPSIPLPGQGALHGAPAAVEPPPVEPNGAGADAAGAAGGGGAAAATPAAAPPPPVPPEQAAAEGKAAGAEAAAAKDAGGKGGGASPAQAAAAKIAA